MIKLEVKIPNKKKDKCKNKMNSELDRVDVVLVINEKGWCSH
jgi:hypothetical protein